MVTITIKYFQWGWITTRMHALLYLLCCNIMTGEDNHCLAMIQYTCICSNGYAHNNSKVCSKQCLLCSLCRGYITRTPDESTVLSLGSVVSQLRVKSSDSCDMVPNRHRLQHKSRRISVAEKCNQAMTREDYNKLRHSVCYSGLLKCVVSDGITIICKYK
jgi:hypothetical protein